MVVLTSDGYPEVSLGLAAQGRQASGLVITGAKYGLPFIRLMILPSRRGVWISEKGNISMPPCGPLTGAGSVVSD